MQEPKHCQRPILRGGRPSPLQREVREIRTDLIE